MPRNPETWSIWTAPLPPAGGVIPRESLRPSIASAVMPVWSPNGQYLLCSSWKYGRWSIACYLVHPNGEAREVWRSVAPEGANDYAPVWAPDGRAVAFVRQNLLHRVSPTEIRRNVRDLVLLRLDAHGVPLFPEIPLTQLGTVQAAYRWDPEQGILFTVETALEHGIAATDLLALHPDANGSSDEPELVSFALPADWLRGLVPVRKSVVFARSVGIAALGVGPGVCEIDEGGRVTVLVRDVGAWPSVSADGRRLAYQSDRTSRR